MSILSIFSTNGLSRSGRQSQSTLSGSIFDVDVAYVPYHGNEHYVDSEFFRRIRARYYILNAVQISPQTLNSLLDGIQQWKKKEHELVSTPIKCVCKFQNALYLDYSSSDVR